MFIAREPNQDPRKPQRGGMVARGGRHAAANEPDWYLVRNPLYSDRFIGTSNRPPACSVLLRSWVWSDAGRNWSPNRLNPARSGHTQRRNGVLFSTIPPGCGVSNPSGIGLAGWLGSVWDV